MGQTAISEIHCISFEFWFTAQKPETGLISERTRNECFYVELKKMIVAWRSFIAKTIYYYCMDPMYRNSVFGTTMCRSVNDSPQDGWLSSICCQTTRTWESENKADDPIFCFVWLCCTRNVYKIFVNRHVETCPSRVSLEQMCLEFDYFQRHMLFVCILLLFAFVFSSLFIKISKALGPVNPFVHPAFLFAETMLTRAWLFTFLL